MGKWKRALGAVIGVGMLSGLWVSPAIAAPGDLVNVPDAAFAQCLQDHVTTEGLSGGLTEGNLAALTSVNCDSRAIASAEGVQFLTGAATISLSNNDLTTLPSISGLADMQELNVNGNRLTNLDFLTNWTGSSETTLELLADDNLIADLSALATITPVASGFYSFSLKNNKIVNAEPLATLGEKFPDSSVPRKYLGLNLGENFIADMSPFARFDWSFYNFQPPGAGIPASIGMDAPCQTVDLGNVAVGAQTPLVIRDYQGNVPVVTPENTGTPFTCLDASFGPERFLPPGNLPAGITWDGTTLVADASLVGTTVEFILGSSTSLFGSGGVTSSWTVRLTIVERVQGVGSVAWQKTDPDQNLLAGSEWELTPATGAAIPVVDNGKNDADPAVGKILVEDLAPGTYHLKETKAPAGFVLDGTEREVTITETNLDIALGNIVNTRVTPPAPTGSVAWQKTDPDQKLLAGSEWELIPTAGTAIPVVDNGPKDADPAVGKIRVQDLPLGTYRLKETKAPTGYVLDGTEREITITAGSLDVTFGAIINTPKTPPPIPPRKPLAVTGGNDSLPLITLGVLLSAVGAGCATLAYRRHRRPLV
ncbi:hypothetical protein G7068_05970 [Leucobacter viscericola]|uniref:SpaA-like prealbumin fold domain-containing protein n=1 Tax=Leucobacter viscericola TaxID=2714935 RepID=A0A6G7XDX4_9MICO|nr:SpaA isopeptide-forming pilin-related protein [Leucobacter viscericola]QIK62794.1 hypothetical protein G7068_05970 [Leucobacter viscericola]